MLQRIAHTEGAVSKNEHGAYEHQYVLRDHLGNTRVTFTDANNDGVVSASDIKQINHYYPFGLNMEGNWHGGAWGQNKYQYNEKELNQDFGLDWNDYGARFYDAAIGRWNGVDKLADLYREYSPYTYVLDNPVKFIDPDGLDVYLVFHGENHTLRIYDDGGTPNDYSDDVFLGEYPAHNNVTRNSNGRWEDGIYPMEDRRRRHTHNNGTDTRDGAYGAGGIYRARGFTETTGNWRDGMAVHAGREHYSNGNPRPFLSRVTEGCVRTTAECMSAIDEAISNHGQLNRIVIQMNLGSTNSGVANAINPAPPTPVPAPRTPVLPVNPLPTPIVPVIPVPQPVLPSIPRPVEPRA